MPSPVDRDRDRARRVPVALPFALLVACSGGDDSGSATATTTATTTAGTSAATTSGTSDTSASTDATATATTTTSTSNTTTSTTASTSTSTTDPTETSGSTTGDPKGCAEAPTFEDGKTPSTILHVAVGGADGPQCGDEEAPCATISGAAAKLAPGAAIQIHAGTYAGGQYLSDLAGTADAPIWIGGAPGEARPILEGGGEALHLTRARYVVLHDLEARGATQNGINIDDGGAYDDPEATRWLVIRGLHIHDIGQGGNEDCLKLSGVDDYVVRGSELDHCGGGGSAIDHVGCHHGLLHANYFHDNGANAVQTKGGSDDIEIRGNRIVDSGERALNMGGSTGFEFFRPPLSGDAPNYEARDIRAIANVIVGSEAPIAVVGCLACLVANNTLVDPQHWILRILQETTSTPEYEFLPASGGALRNNVVIFTRAELSTYVNIGGGTAPETFAFEHNLWYAIDDPALSSPAADLPVAEVMPIAGVDPLVVDLAGGDYHLQAGSPAIDAGADEPALGADHDGVCYGDPPTLGAFEFEG
ncbi:MAG: right-handed parallel beta-helix repeat-containing protein [Nannocystaceae bacterium]